MRRMAFRLKLEKLSYPNAVMCILLGLLMAGVVASGIWLYKKADKPVMRIGNYAITREHLALYQDNLRAKVSSYFYQTYQQDPNEKDSGTARLGETPSQVLRTEAVNALFTDTVERIEAARYEIEVDITLDDIKNPWTGKIRGERNLTDCLWAGNIRSDGIHIQDADGSKGCPEGKTPGDQAEANERTASGVI